ncbi:MAG TPA: carbohydrate kinase family protein [Verrucomicrobiae bacterium]|nr:carbohydrate kinase family protein [Verrucomicrobiae bacterium]
MSFLEGESPVLDAVGVGALNLDRITAVGEDYGIDSDNTFVAEHTDRHVGGSATNTLVAMARHASVGMNCVTGENPNGLCVLEELERRGVYTDGLVRVIPGADTPLTEVIVYKGGGRFILNSITPNSATNQYGEQDAARVTELTAQRPDTLVHAATFLRDKQTQILQNTLKKVSDNGAPVSFSPGALYTFGLDTDGRQVSLLERNQDLFEPVTYLFVNKDEVSGLMEMDYEAAALAYLRRFQRCKSAVITLGAGETIGRDENLYMSVAYVRDEDDLTVHAVAAPWWEPPGAQREDALPIVDTTGAGDSVVAGTLLDIIAKKPWHEVGNTATIMARLCISEYGPTVAVPSPEELEAHYATTKLPMVRTLRL